MSDNTIYINSYEYFYHKGLSTYTHYQSLSQKFLKVYVVVTIDNIPTKPRTYWRMNYLNHQNTKIFEKIIDSN